MQDFLAKLASPDGGPIIAAVFWVGVLTTITATVGMVQWRRYRQSRMDAGLGRRVIDLKRQMIERGMSADEIERVLSAQPPMASSASAVSLRRLPEPVDSTA